ncbi:Mg-dependent DNase [Caldisphaera lagunensis DSM 15908]|uniref:Mg-dependent DNase n=1 Tax=Caldisphaera lagunensis (strain DSM 15908 / JCM 11604 / ANMR 0165 / IC-154) TaxID=1056495 RepID=L0ADJ7_CALLD|nr:TatD family hydrolase [Caldisphaera lagunensis]AFZ71105.1 Mg-dependent DNase [Caldisphaera lagunensis DSM 15908]
MEIYDMHCHLNEFDDKEIEEIIKNDIKIVAVSEDVKSLKRILELSKSFTGKIIPCGGFHPWMIKNGNLDDHKEILNIIEKEGLNCIGEVGIDKRFLDESTYKLQEEIFISYVKLAKELNSFLNIHSPSAWNEVFVVLEKEGIEKAMFHWYTGPTSLINEITNKGYIISLNVALMIQKKHQNIIKETPLANAVVESDGPYNYHGVRLTPLMIFEFIDFISKLINVNKKELNEIFNRNSINLLKK